MFESHSEHCFFRVCVPLMRGKSFSHLIWNNFTNITKKKISSLHSSQHTTRLSQLAYILTKKQCGPGQFGIFGVKGPSKSHFYSERREQEQIRSQIKDPCVMLTDERERNDEEVEEGERGGGRKSSADSPESHGSSRGRSYTRLYTGGKRLQQFSGSFI